MLKVKVSGLKEIEKGLFELKSGTAKGAVRRSLKKAGELLAADAAARAPRSTPDMGAEGHIGDSFVVTGRLTRYARRPRRKDEVHVAVGPSLAKGSPGFVAAFQEFGTAHHGPQPFFRPAWDHSQHEMLGLIVRDMRVQVEKAVARARRKAARSGR